MKSYFAQTSFVAGEVSPRLLGRPDTDLYRSGLGTLENMVVRPHGPVERRGGFEHIAKITNKAAGRTFGFQVTPSIAYMVVVMPALLQIISPSGQKEGDNVVLNSSFSTGATNWTGVTAIGGQVAFNSIAGIARLDVEPNVGSKAIVRQQVPTLLDNYWLMVERPDAPTYPAVTIRVGTAAGLSDIALYSNVDIRRFKQKLACPAANIWIEVELATAGAEENTAITQIGLYRDTGATVTQVAPYTVGDLRQVRLEQPPNQTAGEATGYLVHPNYAPLKLKYVIATDTWTLAPVAFVGTPAEWAGTNYPGALTFFQGRSFWGGTPNEPETFWASKSTNIEDMTIGVAPADGFKLTLSRRGGIRWMMGIKNLLIGTETGEHIVTSQGGVLIPGDATAEQQSAFGATTFAGAVPIGNTAAYITGDQRKMRLMGYRWEESAWVSVDLTFPSEHISLGLLTSLVWAQAPENLVLMTDAEGQLISCTYEPTLKTTGWQRFTGWEHIYDVGVQIIDGRAVIWISRSVYDAVANQIHTYIERADPSTFMDSFITQIFTAAQSIITGLGHLEGQVVQVIVDGALHPDRTVVGGQITLQAGVTGLHVTVGKKYTSTVTMLPWEEKAQGGIGQSLAAKKSMGKVWARVLQSYLPKIDGEMAADRTPSTPMGTAEPATSGDVHTVDLGWDRRKQPTIQQDLPGPFMLLAIFGEWNLGNN